MGLFLSTPPAFPGNRSIRGASRQPSRQSPPGANKPISPGQSYLDPSWQAGASDHRKNSIAASFVSGLGFTQAADQPAHFFRNPGRGEAAPKLHRVRNRQPSEPPAQTKIATSRLLRAYPYLGDRSGDPARIQSILGWHKLRDNQ